MGMKWINSFLAFWLVGMVRFYQVAMRPLLPSVCRYYPSCSAYFIEAVGKYGPLSGGVARDQTDLQVRPLDTGWV